MTPEKQALLKKLLAQKGVAVPPTDSSLAEALRPRPADEAPVMSFAQERLWFVQKLQPANPAYHLGQGFILRGKLDPVALGEALAALIRRHETLRTAFPEREGRGALAVLPPSAIDATVLAAEDLSRLPVAEQTRELAARQTEVLEAPFDLARAPLLRARLVRLGREEYRLLFCVHHLVFDGWSIDVFTRELGALYAGESDGASLPPLALSYADYAAWQRRRAASPAWEASREFWCNQLANTPQLILPADHDRPAALSGRGAGHRFELPAALVAELRAVGQREGATLYMTLLAAWQVMLGRYAGQRDFAVGSPVANRPEAALEGMVGFFVNMIAQRADLAADPAFDVHLGKVVRATQAAFEHQEMPFEQIVERLRVPRDLSHHPVFQVGFTFQHAAAGTVALAGVEFTPLAAPITAAKFDLLLMIEDRGDGDVSALFEYSTDLFRAATMARWAENFLTLLHGVVAEPTAPISRLPLVSAAERASWPAAPTPRPQPTGPATLVAWFAATARAQGERIAVTDGEIALTYQELAQRSDQLAWCLHARGVVPGDLVGLALESSSAVLVAVLGILKVGAGYLPIDPAYPADRRDFMLADAGAVLLLSADPTPVAVPRLDILTQWAEVAATPMTDLPEPRPEDRAYVIYTSGSTGQPKGVPITHRHVTRLFTQTDHWFGFGPDDVWTLFHSFAFDFSVWEIWGALLHGGRLVVVPFAVSRAVDRFRDLLVREGVTVLSQTPSAFRQLVNLETSGEVGASPSPLVLKWVVFGGEALDLATLAPWIERYGDAAPQLINMYGITETTVHVTYRRIRAEDVAANTGSVIGEPIPDLAIHLLDANLQPVPIGVAGEIVVGGAGLAAGYLNRPELTAERFIQHPLAGEGGRLYRSGDSARRLANGDLEYLGRIDFQVKVRGFRIELGEIESALNRHPAITGAAVLAQQDAAGDTRLAAWLVAGEAAAGAELDVTVLRAHLRQFLPDYMVPAVFTWVEALPLTINGKVDRAALPGLAGARAEVGTVPEAPATGIERELAAVWARVLGVETVGVTDNFFALGGDSIRSIEVRAAVRKTGWDFPLQELFRRQTVRELAAVLTRMETEGDQKSVGPFDLIAPDDRAKLSVNVEAAYPLSALQAGMVFHAELQPDSPVFHDLFSYHLRMTWDEAALREALARMVTRHEILRTSLHPGGFSQPLQVVHAQAVVPLTVIDLQEQSDARQDAMLATWRETEKARGFDWAVAPLLRVTVHVRSATTVQVSLSLHHAILDGWSVSVLLAELFTAYLDDLAGRKSEAGVASPPFREFVALERAAVESSETRAFWATQLDDAPAGRLPRRVERPTAVEPATQGAIFHTWKGPMVAAWQALAASEGVTLKHVLLAAHAKVVAHGTGEREVVTGVISNGRPETDGAAGALGLFLNTVPYRLAVRPGAWRELVRSVWAVDGAVWPHRRYPLAEMQKDAGGAARFETAFNFVHFHVLDELRAREDLDVLGADYFDQNTFDYFAQFSADSAAGTVQLELRFNPAEFTEAQVLAWVATYDRVLTAMATEPDERHEITSWLALPERNELVDTFNAAPLPGERPRRLHDGFWATVARTPEAVALVVGEERLTYADLGARVRRAAAELRRRGAGPEKLVGVCLERGIDLVITLLAVLESGAAYVPLDPAYPVERLGFMCEDAGVTLLVSRRELAAGLPAGGWSLVEPTSWAESTSAHLAPVDVRPENLAYLIYTSGSTGRPKATAIEHRQATALLAWAQATYAESDLAGVLGATSVSFDLSVFELFVTLAAGGKLIVADNALALPELPARDEVTLINTVPSAIAELVRQQAIPRSVRVVNLAGEPLSATLADAVYDAAAVAHVYDLYGPSEDTTYSTMGRRERGGVATIGRVLPGSQLYLLDQDGQPVPPGVVGEIYLGGAGVARGYLGRPDLTADRFGPDPFSGVPGARLYRTGDVARFRADGQLEFLGRRDHQVKIRGFRIELGEIQHALEQHTQIAEAAVVAVDTVDGGPRLVAYVAGDSLPEGRKLDELCRPWLLARLPEYFVPAVFVGMSALPRTPNGKLDRRALPTPPDPGTVGAEEDFAAPRTATEATLADIWTQVLKVPRVGIHDNYFALGGDSIQVLQLAARAREAGLDVSPKSVFANPTVADLARTAGTALGAAVTVTDDLSGSLPLTPVQEWFFAQDFAAAHHWNQSVLLTVREPLEVTRVEAALRAVVAHHPMLRARFAADANGRWSARVAEASAESLAFGVVRWNTVTELTEACAAEQAALDLAEGPLVRALWLEHTAGAERRFFVVVHHLVVDGVSWRILLEDLWSAYTGAELPPPTVSMAAWAGWLKQTSGSAELSAEAAHWQALAARPVTCLPQDGPGGCNTVAEAKIYRVTLSPAETETLLRRALAAYGCQINDLLLAALAGALREWTGADAMTLHLEGHGREGADAGIDLSRSVGWFTALYPVSLDISGVTDSATLVPVVAEQLATVPRRGLGYGIGRWLSEPTRWDVPAAEVCFNYLGQFDGVVAAEGPFGSASEDTGSPTAPTGQRAHLIDVNGLIVDGALKFDWHYAPGLHRRETVARVANRHFALLREMLAAVTEGRVVTPVDPAQKEARFDLTDASDDDLASAIEEIEF
jgi:amino acid adenylation domain-containing protein/non-ribosomal peptide synthase protein (TIGR01720 family)